MLWCTIYRTTTAESLSRTPLNFLWARDYGIAIQIGESRENARRGESCFNRRWRRLTDFSLKVARPPLSLRRRQSPPSRGVEQRSWNGLAVGENVGSRWRGLEIWRETLVAVLRRSSMHVASSGQSSGKLRSCR